MTALIDMVRVKCRGTSLLPAETQIWRGLALAGTWLVIINLFALLSFNRLNLAPDNALEWMSAQSVTPVRQSWNLIELHNRWDAYWYLDIAQNGYYLRGEKGIANVVFFPLYPLLIRLVAPGTGGNLVLAGWILSSVFLVLAVLVLTRLIQEFHPDIDPLLPSVFLLAYPTAFFLNAVYSESLFLFLSLAMVFWALRRNFPLAGVCAALASATRIAGVFLLVLLFIEFVQANGWRGLWTRRAWPLALAPVGALAFFVYHWIAFGDFFLYLKVQNFYGRDFDIESNYFDIRNRADMVHTILEIFFTTITILLGFIALRRFRLSYGAYVLVSLAVALSSGTTLGIPRYAMVLFPIHLVGAGLKSVVGRCAWLFSSALLLALNIICFVNHYWAG
jgi:Gpi18-like mannosyltransferase